MNNIELNSIFFYADFLSLKSTSQPVTDNCKYFFIYGCPINSAFILNMEPIYDPENKYLLQAFKEYNMLKEYRQWKSNYKYTHQTFDENGNPQETQCTRFFKHAEESARRSRLHKSINTI